MADERDKVATKWRTISRDDVQWVAAGGDYVAYHRPSGTTHLLNAASESLLNEILVTLQTAAAAAAALGAPDIAPTLERLEELGFIERL